jgi:hypothetical protein
MLNVVKHLLRLHIADLSEAEDPSLSLRMTNFKGED